MKKVLHEKTTRQASIQQAHLRRNSKLTAHGVPTGQKVSRSKNTNPRHRPLQVNPMLKVVQQKKLLIETPNAAFRNSIEYPTPTWFRFDEKADVSVIVPLYKSESVIVDLINSWTVDHDNLKVEVIFVDDNCPKKSRDFVVKAWEKKSTLLKDRRLGRIIYNTQNLGYGGACNTGAEYATGDYLIFLNADTRVTANWITPLVKAISDPTIGIVGNLQLKDGGDLHGTIDSAGSEWRWESGYFSHIARHTYKDKNLVGPFSPLNAPEDIMRFGERDMVTGCCFGIRAELFRSIGGFNPNYRIGYWEDSEICMAVKEKGYRVVFDPASVIYHKLGHTNSGNHQFQTFNYEFFANKWVKTGRIDPLIHNPRKTLPVVGTILIQRLGAHGDVLTAASVCPALKKKHPGCKIIFLTQVPNVLEGNPYINRVISRQEQISERSFDVFYNLDMSYEYRPHSHLLESYADVVGVPVEDCQNFLKTGTSNYKNWIIIHPGRTNWVGREWSPENFSIIASRLMDRGEKVLCIGDNDDYVINCTENRRRLDDIPTTAAIIKDAKLFIGIDSFPMHIAQTFNVPGVCFFGCVDPKLRIYSDKMKSITAQNLACLGCHHKKPAPCTVTNNCETGTLDCVKNVSVEKMWTEILKIL